MSFNFSWKDAFSPSFHQSAKSTIEAALNKGSAPKLIEGRIEVRSLDMGSVPPTLTLLEIGDLQTDRFRGIFRLGYAGDASMEIGARVQANPLSAAPSPFPSQTPLAASRPLVVPMSLTLRNLRLRAIVVLVVSKQKGITLVFKNDPLESLDVSSTFDGIAVLKGFIQRAIEDALREMFREDLPGIIHTLSQQWFTDSTSSTTPAAAGSVVGDGNHPSSAESALGIDPQGIDVSPPSSPSATSMSQPIFPSYHPSPSVSSHRTPSRSTTNPRPSVISPQQQSPPSHSTFPDIEDYDPTYGLRPEGLPTHSVFAPIEASGSGLGRLWEKSRGLSELVRTPSDEDVNHNHHLDDGWNEITPALALHRGHSHLGFTTGDAYSDYMSDIDDAPPSAPVLQQEFEVIPAVGGGTVTRPRVYHAQNSIRPPSSDGGWAEASARTWSSSQSGVATGSTIRSESTQRRPSTPGRLPSSAPLSRRMTSHTAGFSSPLAGYSSPLAGYGSPALGGLGSPKQQHQAFAANSRRNTTSSAHHRYQTPPLTYSHSGTPSGSNSNSLVTPASSRHTSASPPSAFNQRGNKATAASSSGGSSFNQQHGPSSLSQSDGGLPETISHLSLLSMSNHTLSPYTREHAHVAVRSQPHIYRSNSAIGWGVDDVVGSPVVVKANRKRVYRMGGGKAATAPSTPSLGTIKESNSQHFNQTFSSSQDETASRTPMPLKSAKGSKLKSPLSIASPLQPLSAPVSPSPPFSRPMLTKPGSRAQSYGFPRPAMDLPAAFGSIDGQMKKMHLGFTGPFSSKGSSRANSTS